MNITYKQVPPRLHMQVKDLLNALGIHNEDPLNIHFGLLASKHSVCAYDVNDNGEEKLIAIARALDDTCYNAYLDYVIIHPDYRHKKIATEICTQLIASLKDVTHIYAAPETEELEKFYEYLGFEKKGCRMIYNKKSQ